MRLIDAEALRKEMQEYVLPITTNNLMGAADAYYRILHLLEDAPTIEAYTGAEYMHLLKLAKKMHTWIFLHTLNEDETYKELGLTDEDNALLGSFGKFYYSCNPNTKPFPQAYENGDHIAEDGKKEPICGHPQEGVKIPVISMEDVPKIAKEMEK